MERQHLSKNKNAIAPQKTKTEAIARSSLHPIEEMQALYGNRAVNQLLAVQRERGRGGDAKFSTSDSQHEAALAIQRKPFGEKVQREAIPEEDKEIQGKASVQTENKTGLPDNLKAGIENLSGLAMDDVRVHYNSPKPVELNALAYTQGKEIYVAPGQEKHLPHEAWHVVQQMQGRVKPTMQMKGVEINDDRGLEKEAEAMGARLNNEGTNNLQWRVESKGQSSNTSHNVLKEQTKKNQPLFRETPLLTPTIQKMKTRYRQREEERRLEKQGLSIRHIVEGRRRTRKPDFLGQPPSSYLDRHGNRLFNPGSAAVMVVRMKLSGDSRKDIEELIRRTGRGSPGRGEVWHHMGDYDEITGEGTIVLLPTYIHAANRHIGGSALARASIWQDPDRKGKYGLTQRKCVGHQSKNKELGQARTRERGLNLDTNPNPVQLYSLSKVDYFDHPLADIVRTTRLDNQDFAKEVNYACLFNGGSVQTLRSGGPYHHSEMLLLTNEIKSNPTIYYKGASGKIDQADLRIFKYNHVSPIMIYTERIPCDDRKTGGLLMYPVGCSQVLREALKDSDLVFYSFDNDQEMSDVFKRW